MQAIFKTLDGLTCASDVSGEPVKKLVRRLLANFRTTLPDGDTVSICKFRKYELLVYDAEHDTAIYREIPTPLWEEDEREVRYAWGVFESKRLAFERAKAAVWDTIKPSQIEILERKIDKLTEENRQLKDKLGDRLDQLAETIKRS